MDIIQQGYLWIMSLIAISIDLAIGLCPTFLTFENVFSLFDPLEHVCAFLAVSGFESNATEKIFEGCRASLGISHVENRYRQYKVFFLVCIVLASFHDPVGKFSRSSGIGCQTRWNGGIGNFVSNLFHVFLYGKEFGLVFFSMQHLLKNFETRGRHAKRIAELIFNWEVKGVLVFFWHLDRTCRVVPHFEIMYFHFSRRDVYSDVSVCFRKVGIGGCVQR